MAFVSEKPGVLERLGSAVNSTDLSPVEGRIGAVELLGAMAYTQINPDASEHLEVDAAVIDPRTELASVLVRLKYGGDRVLGDRAVLLLLQWVRHQRAFRNWRIKRGQDEMLGRFVRHSLAEWLYPVCQECSGREYLGMDKEEIIEKRIRCTRCRGLGSLVVKSQIIKSRHGAPVAKDCLGCGGKGWKTYRRVRQSKVSQCGSCRGTGRELPNDSEREYVLGVEHRVYERHWLRRFNWLAAGLDRIDTLQKYCLQSQMRAGIKHA